MVNKPFASSCSYPVRTTNGVEYFIDGESAFDAIAGAVESATKYVYITCAFATLDFRLRPGQATSLLDLCGRAAERGVTVALLIWLPGMQLPDTIPVAQASLVLSRGILARWDRAKCSGIYAPFPLLACHHQKTVVIDGERAFVGGINMVQSYWDTREHRSIDERRVSFEIADPVRRRSVAQDKYSLPLHDVFSAFSGEAVMDVEANFVERWNGASNRISPTDLMVTANAPEQQQPVRIQVLRTIAPRTYPHISAGEASIKEAMLNLLDGANDCIYFENQYFFDNEVVAAVRAAAKRGVRVVGLLCRRPDAGEAVGVLESFLDSASEARLQWTAFNPALRSYIQLYSPVTTDLPTKDIYVHAKLMIVDDRYVLLGSANIAFPSLEFHSEMCILVDDRAGARALRRSLFAEHLCLPASEVPEVFADGANLWRSSAQSNKRLLDSKQAAQNRVVALDAFDTFEDEPD